jgi:nitric oxide reductase NorQ protein
MDTKVSSKELIFYPTDNEIEVFENCFKLQLPLLLKGPTGCGKSQLVEVMAQRLNRPLIKVACNEDTNAADLMGRFLIQNGDTVWQDGPVTRALKTDALLYLDEFAEAREDVIVALHPLTDHRRELYIDKINLTVKASPNFMLIASYNPGYQKGLKEIKPSTKQRFIVTAMNYLPAEQEKNLLVALTGIESKWAHSLSNLAHKIRSKEGLMLKETISTRLIVNAASLIKLGMNPRKACHVSISEVLSDDREIVKSLNDFINLHI